MFWFRLKNYVVYIKKSWIPQRISWKIYQLKLISNHLEIMSTINILTSRQDPGIKINIFYDQEN